MMFFRRTVKQPEVMLACVDIKDGQLIHRRSNGALTCVDIDDLRRAELRVLEQQLYWYLEDQRGAFALIAERTEGIGRVRRYLSSWRGFDYDGLLRFDSEQQSHLQLWPMLLDRAA